MIICWEVGFKRGWGHGYKKTFNIKHEAVKDIQSE